MDEFIKINRDINPLNDDDDDDSLQQPYGASMRVNFKLQLIKYFFFFLLSFLF
jgi:hypothetical protein